MIRCVPSIVLSFGFLSVLIPAAFSQDTAKPNGKGEQVPAGRSSDANVTDHVLTKDDRDGMTPSGVLQMLKSGNERFVAGSLTQRDHTKQVRQAVQGQNPKAFVLSCVDSRVPVEDVFDRGIGDIFVARVAGNFVNTDILGSMEFGCKVSGAKLLLVLGHENCGAVKGAIDKVELGNITPMLKNIRPAVDFFGDYAGEKSGSNKEFVHMVAERNVRMSMARIRERSPILREMESRGQLKIVGALYDMDSGAVEFLRE